MADKLLEEKAIFNRARQIAAPDERFAYLQEACGHDPAAMHRLLELLRVYEEQRSFLESSPVAHVTTLDVPIAECPGTFIGPYKLLEQIGEGGFGVVFVAEQTEPVRRKVALKVLKPGMDTRQVVARFEAERQALAIMDHPNIAKVHDGGETASGRPYFVMELVKGVPITDYCDENQLTPRERLELFLHVCRAVQHAHQKGIIHRDIKPSNVLVASHDGVPLVKIIDFGVAKAVGQQLTERTLYTQFAQFIGTPLYMSPEQAGQSSVDVDTRSDIYSLGVLLYELLTGTTPFDRERLKAAGLDEIRRIIREEEPLKPSARLSTLGAAATTASTRRQSDPRRLSQLLRGDLDWIVMKALEKDRARRYETTSAFAVDVQHYLHDEPVLARPPGASYRARKFVRRHRGPVLAASLVLLALVGGVIGTSFGLLRAQHAADRERGAKETAQRRLTQIEKANEILGSIFKDLNPEDEEKMGKPLRALLGERLDQATAQLEGEIIGDSLAVARMQVTLGESQLGLGYAEKAIRLLSKARTILTAQLGQDHPDTLESMSLLAQGYWAAGKFDLALPLYEETLRRKKVTLGPEHPDTLTSMNNLAVGYKDAGKLDLALPLLEEVLRRSKVTLGPDHRATNQSMGNLALVYQDAGKLDLALPLLEEAFKRRKAKLGPDHRYTLIGLNNLAVGYKDAGKLDLALPLYEEALRRTKVTLGPDHPDTLRSMNNLGMAYWAAGKLDLALPSLEETLKMVKAQLGPDHRHTLVSMSNLGTCYFAAGKIDLALPLYEESLRRRKATLGPDHPDTLQSMNGLGAGYEAAGKLDLALPLLEETLKLIKVKLGPDHPRTLKVMNNLGRCYIRAGQSAKAQSLLRECLAIGEKKEPDAWTTFDAKSMLGAALLGQKDYAGAEPLLLAGYQGLKQREAKIPAREQSPVVEAMERLVQLYEATGNKYKAQEWQEKLAEAKARSRPASKP